jgi:hypothetical protein
VTTGRREISYVATVAAGTVSLHIFFPALPLVFTLPNLITYTVASPLLYLTLIAVTMELFSVQPPGVTAAIVFLPYAVSRLTKQIPVDVSVAFLLLVTLTTLGQFVMLFLPDMFRLLTAHGLSPQLLPATAAVIPWWQAAWVGLPALLTFVASILIHFNRR